jgi:hypothetical protein
MTHKIIYKAQAEVQIHEIASHLSHPNPAKNYKAQKWRTHTDTGSPEPYAARARAQGDRSTSPLKGNQTTLGLAPALQ